MCGINGILDSGAGGCHKEAVSHMNIAVAHRGPDGEGMYNDQNITLGHRRLSIIDLTDNASQPMDGGSATIVFNGEIYNYRQLREELKQMGVEFRSESDTEVILSGYEMYGEGIFEKLEGMFAIGLWDRGSKSLFLARDGCGVKPIFYYKSGGLVVFSSEIKGLLASGLVPRVVDRKALSDFLSYFYVPSPRAIIEGVKQVEAGCYLKIDEAGDISKNEFWNIDKTLGDNKSKTLGSNASQVLRDESSVAVSSVLESDVPVSLLLSSGLDSSVILYELKKKNRADIETITVGFNESSYDEGEEASRLSSEFGFKNTLVKIDGLDIKEAINDITYSLDSLNANPCIIAEYRYFKEVGKRFKVTLMGSGNDELMAGYPTYRADRIRKYYGVLPYFVRWMGFKVAAMLPASDEKYSFEYFAKKFTEGSLFDKEKSHYYWRTIFGDGEKKKLLKSEVSHDSFMPYKTLFDRVRGKASFEDSTLYTDFYRFCIDNANIEVDQLSMAFSVEARPPFLTKRFAEHAFKIPFSEKLVGSKTKECLREAYKFLLPDFIISKKKSGLVSPLKFLKDEKYATWVLELITSPHMEKYFNIDEVKKLYKEHIGGKANNSYRIFSLLCFANWHKHFIEPASDKK